MADGTHFNTAEVIDLAAERISRRWLEPVTSIPKDRQYGVRCISWVPVVFDAIVSASSPEEALATASFAARNGLISGVVQWDRETDRLPGSVRLPDGQLVKQV